MNTKHWRTTLFGWLQFFIWTAVIFVGLMTGHPVDFYSASVLLAQSLAIALGLHSAADAKEVDNAVKK